MIHAYSKNHINSSAKALFVASVVGAAGLSAGSASAQPTETVLYSFCQQMGCIDGYFPMAGLIATNQGGLYGTTVYGGNIGEGVAFLVTVNGGNGLLHVFQGEPMDGANPSAPLFRDKSGNFFGTTELGGSLSESGTIFERSAAGSYRLRHVFTGSDGAAPVAGVLADSAGNLYGTTSGGGANNEGTIFVLTPSGILKTLHNFCSTTACADGEIPFAGLIGDANGNLYGTASGGGANEGSGVVFKIHADGTNYTVLHTFGGIGNLTDGSDPLAGLAADASGTLYGTTQRGGTGSSCEEGGGCGTVFKLSPDGSNYAVLYNFCSLASCADGFGPKGGVIVDAAGNLYGTTTYGGANNSGAVFSLTPSGTETVLYSFCSLASCADGLGPTGNLAVLGNGNLYGTTPQGGANLTNSGTVYQLTGSGFVLPTSTAER
jgi:uncharacterized repeat protein (TIGR03803 family)